MTDWNKVPRDEVEMAAARGDEGANCVVKMHQRIDRIEASVGGIRADMTRLCGDIDRETTDAKAQLAELKRERGGWLHRLFSR